MKKWLYAVPLLFLSVYVHAGKPLVAEAPVNEVGTGTTVSISTSAWTKVPTSQTSGRTGIKVCNPSNNSGTMYGVMSSNSSSPTEATSVRPIEIQAGENPIIPISDRLYLYLISGHSAAESAHVQEIRQ